MSIKELVENLFLEMMLWHDDKTRPFLYVETSALTEGKIPKDAVSVSCECPLSNQHWREAARYILYEEIYDAERGIFDNPQCPTVPYYILDRFINILRRDLQMTQSDASMYEYIVPEIAAYLTTKEYLSGSNGIRQFERTLLAPRWHPEITASHNRRVSVRQRRISMSLKSGDGVESTMVNKTLSQCLPENCEAFSIMTGHIPSLKRNLYLLVRLTAEPVPKLNGLVEVDVGIRFIFLALTPKVDEDAFLFQMSRCFASMLGEYAFSKSMYRAQNPVDLYKSALRFRKNMNTFPMRYEDILNKTRGINVPFGNVTEIQYDQSDLVFNSLTDGIEGDDFTDADTSLGGDTLVHCTLRACNRFCPPFHELYNGLKTLLKRMPSDYTDAFTRQNVGTVASSILFIYFVIFGPAITFGTLMLQEVHPSFNISLNIFATGIFSVLYSLFAGQPLGSVGPSGPGYIIETVIAYFASVMNADYQIYRFWIGIYTAAFGVFLISLNLSSMVVYARRSLEELFSGFISAFLILKALFTMFKAIPQSLSEPVSTEDMILASQAAVQLFLAFCMLIFSISINNLKRSHFFRRKIRYWLGALNVPLGIVFVSLLTYIFFSSYPIVFLRVPSASQANPTEWINVVNFSSLSTFQEPSPALLHSMALLIGFFLSLLIFVETALNSVTALKSKAEKPSPFVVDHVLTVVIFPLMSCILGWPFISGVPVRTIANTMALVQLDPHPPPGKPAEIIKLVEQRVSVLIAGLLVTVSVCLGDILRLIPVAALYGMFIFLGLNGLNGLDSVNTLFALLTRRKYWNRWEFLTNLPRPQLAVIVTINFAELAALILFVVLAEFTNAGYITLITPLIFIFSGLLREFILPKWNWLAPCLAKYDKRCLPNPNKDTKKARSENAAHAESDQSSSVETLVF